MVDKIRKQYISTPIENNFSANFSPSSNKGSNSAVIIREGGNLASREESHLQMDTNGSSKRDESPVNQSQDFRTKVSVNL
jgi:hypothetical protein